MAGKVFEECGCVYYRDDRGFRYIQRRCDRCEAREEALSEAEAAENERLGDRGYWR